MEIMGKLVATLFIVCGLAGLFFPGWIRWLILFIIRRKLLGILSLLVFPFLWWICKALFKSKLSAFGFLIGLIVVLGGIVYWFNAKRVISSKLRDAVERIKDDVFRMFAGIVLLMGLIFLRFK